MPGEQQNPKDRKPGPDDRFDWKRAAKTFGFWAILIIAVIVISAFYGNSDSELPTKIYTEYRNDLSRGNIASAIVIDREFHATLKDSSQYKTIIPPITPELVDEWEQAGVKVEFRERSTNWMGYVLTSILPWIVLIFFWFFLMRRMQSGGTRGIFSFGKSRAKLLIDNRPKVTFKDVAGGEEAKEELQEIIQFLKEPKKFQKLGGRIPKGALLIGPPGTGKTLMGRAIAGEAEVPFFSMSGADFVEMFVGVGASRVRDLFEQGKKHAPCIIFIDEIDAVGRQRGAGLGGGHDEREQTLNQLLVEMDGFESNEGVILVAATNRPDVLDPALLRPGRFDRQIMVDLPDVRGREGILKVHSRGIPLAKDVNLNVLAKGTPGLSGADIENLVNEAALLAARRDAQKVSMADFEDAKDKVMMGTERKSMIISDEEKRLTAYHEAGHTLVAMLLPGSDPVHKVTIIPRGRAMGVTHFLPIDEKHSWSKKFIELKLVHLAGGRAAERLIFDDYTNGAAADIKQSTDIARKMVCEWGMSEKIGPLSLSNQSEEVFLGRDITSHRVYSDSTSQEIDREIKRIVQDSHNKAIELLQDNMDKLHLLASALLEREILDGEEIRMVMDGKKLPPAGKKRKPRRRPPRRSSRTRAKTSGKEGTTKTTSKTPPRDSSTKERLSKVDEVLKKIKSKEAGESSSSPRRRTYRKSAKQDSSKSPNLQNSGDKKQNSRKDSGSTSTNRDQENARREKDE